jgi:hypothetical protein
VHPRLPKLAPGSGICCFLDPKQVKTVPGVILREKRLTGAISAILVALRLIIKCRANEFHKSSSELGVAHPRGF